MALAVPLLRIGPAAAQAFASRPITVIEPFAAGGSVDAMVRAIAERTAASLGQPLVVDARPGAGTRIGTDAIRRAPKDGYTIGVMVSASGVNIPALDPKVSYDPVADFTPLTLGFESYFAIMANPKHGWRTLADLLAAARAKPGTITYGSSGVGTSSHVWPEVFQAATGTRFVHVPYKGEALTIQDLIGGSIDLMFAGPGIANPHVEGGRLTALAVTAPERHPLLPAVPTADEQGVKRFTAGGWIAFVAPAGFTTGALPPERFTEQLRRGLALVGKAGREAKIVME
jgi:tripartite-type tricarboxylate transporter receptor subunit TctC